MRGRRRVEAAPSGGRRASAAALKSASVEFVHQFKVRARAGQMSDWNNEQFAELLQSDVATTGERHTFIIRLRAEPSREANGGIIWRGEVEDYENSRRLPIGSVGQISERIRMLLSINSNKGE